MRRTICEFACLFDVADAINDLNALNYFRYIAHVAPFEVNEVAKEKEYHLADDLYTLENNFCQIIKTTKRVCKVEKHVIQVYTHD